jgi:hypothetical protein
MQGKKCLMTLTQGQFEDDSKEEFADCIKVHVTVKREPVYCLRIRTNYTTFSEGLQLLLG